MSKTIVTHINPDLDAITAAWLLVRFGGRDFQDANFAFVPAGERYTQKERDVVHVDTGLGEFDHHQEERGKEDTSAAKLVYEWLVSEGKTSDQEALRRLVEQVKDLDHFRNYFWHDPLNDRYEFFLGSVLNGVKLGGVVKNDRDLLGLGFRLLDGVITSYKIKIAAEEDIRKGIVFETKWGKTLAVESSASSVMKVALKSGYRVVIRKDPETGMVRITSAPLAEIDLREVYDRLKERDPKATWFFHPSGHMVLNGSTRNPKMRPSTLSLEEVMIVLKGFKD